MKIYEKSQGQPLLRSALKIGILLALLLCFAGPHGPTEAAVTLCATCSPVSVPDPMHPWGGAFGRWVCVWDTGHASGCVELNVNACVEIGPGDCW